MKTLVQYLESQNATFGQPVFLLHRIEEQTISGCSMVDLAKLPEVQKSGLLDKHLLRIRRAIRRFESLQKGGPDPQEQSALEWAARHVGHDLSQIALVQIFQAAVASALKMGRLRFHLKSPEHPLAAEYLEWAGHSEGCLELGPHRWFAAKRGVHDGVIWIEVLFPEDEVSRHVRKTERSMLVADLMRALEKPVLREIESQAEQKVIQSASEALYALLSRPPLSEPVAGIVLDAKQVFGAVVGGEWQGACEQFSVEELDRVVAWVAQKDISWVAVATLKNQASISGLVGLFSAKGITVEPARNVGLMKQAKRQGGPIKFAAALVAAQRLKDPVEGYAELSPDELGLGEYLDLVNPDLLKAALQDAKDAAIFRRGQGKTKTPVVRGVVFNSMVKSLEDLVPGMELTGVVANLTHFGVFVELGLGTQGLVHLSELSEKFIKHPSEVVQVGERIKVRVLMVQPSQKKISLTARLEQARTRKTKKPQKESLQALHDLFKK